MRTRCAEKLGAGELTSGQSFLGELSLATLGLMALAICSVKLATTAPTQLRRYTPQLGPVYLRCC